MRHQVRRKETTMTRIDPAALGAPRVVEGPAVDTLSSVVPAVARLLGEREAARAQATDLARDKQRLAAFLSLASHELRGPATSSSLGVQLAVQRVDLLRQQAAQYDATLADQLAAVNDGLTTAASSLERLARRVGDLLDLSRLQVGQLHGQAAAADLLAHVPEARE